MKTIKILKQYKHTERRTWQPDDTPTVSSTLADELIKKGIATLITQGDTRMDIQEEEEDKDWMEPLKKASNQKKTSKEEEE